jgi:hypothetical protein
MLWSREKYLAPARNWTRTVKHVARCYSNWAIPASPSFHLTSISGPNEVWVWYWNILPSQHTGNWKQDGVCNPARWAASTPEALETLPASAYPEPSWDPVILLPNENCEALFYGDSGRNANLTGRRDEESVELQRTRPWMVSGTWMELQKCQVHRLGSVSWVLLVSDVTQTAVIVILNLASFIEWIINRIESARKEPWHI